MQETPVRFLDQEDPLEKTGYPLQYSWTSLAAQMVKKSAYNAGDLGWWIGENYKQVYYVDKHPFTEVVALVHTNAWVV